MRQRLLYNTVGIAPFHTDRIRLYYIVPYCIVSHCPSAGFKQGRHEQNSSNCPSRSVAAHCHHPSFLCAPSSVTKLNIRRQAIDIGRRSGTIQHNTIPYNTTPYDTVPRRTYYEGARTGAATPPFRLSSAPSCNSS